MDFNTNGNTTSSDDPFKYVSFTKGDSSVTLDGDFTVDDLKQIIEMMEK